jgi:bacillithiol biosynthesis deacetylase BshB1
MKVDILAFGIHPDDIELSCSGTLLQHISMGHSVGLCDLTEGELGTRGNAKLRHREAENARIKMGAKFRYNLKMPDGFTIWNKENILAIARIIRLHQPKIILANAISDRHPDHGRGAKLVADASFYSGLSKIEIKNSEGEVLPKWRPQAVYHYVQDRNIPHDFLVDISGFFEKKIDLILTFESQFYKDGDEGPQTPISGKNFMDFMRAKNKSYGRDLGVDYAEAFTVNRDIGVKNLFNLI